MTWMFEGVFFVGLIYISKYYNDCREYLCVECRKAYEVVKTKKDACGRWIIKYKDVLKPSVMSKYLFM